MSMFIVSKEGVYRHEVYGFYGSLDEAKVAAQKLCEAEHDDYHSFAVLTKQDGEELMTVTTLKRDNHEKWQGGLSGKIVKSAPTSYTWE